jgi:hypothetical protein
MCLLEDTDEAKITSLEDEPEDACFLFVPFGNSNALPEWGDVMAVFTFSLQAALRRSAFFRMPG